MAQPTQAPVSRTRTRSPVDVDEFDVAAVLLHIRPGGFDHLPDDAQPFGIVGDADGGLGRVHGLSRARRWR